MTGHSLFRLTRLFALLKPEGQRRLVDLLPADMRHDLVRVCKLYESACRGEVPPNGPSWSAGSRSAEGHVGPEEYLDHLLTLDRACQIQLPLRETTVAPREN